MEPFQLDAAEDTPLVHFDPANSIFEISGKIYPEDPVNFFAPITDWINKYAESPLPESVFTLKLKYFNTASAKLLLDILVTLGDISDDKGKVRVKWIYNKMNEDMEEVGEEFEDMSGLDFEFAGY